MIVVLQSSPFSVSARDCIEAPGKALTSFASFLLNLPKVALETLHALVWRNTGLSSHVGVAQDSLNLPHHRLQTLQRAVCCC